MNEQKDNSYTGRKRIYTDYTEIDGTNIIEVLRDSLIIHGQNCDQITYLKNYESGIQPLTRPKIVRPDIDIKVCDNVASEVVDFKLGYNWGSPIEITQRSNTYPINSDSNVDDNAITLLNNMLKS